MESIVVTSQFVSGRRRISLSLASLVLSRPARGSLDSANGRNRYMIARALFAMLTLVAFASSKGSESQCTEGFDGFASSSSRTRKTAFSTTHCGVAVGDGRCSRPMHPINKWRSTTKKTVSPVTFQPNRPTGSTSKVIQFSVRSKQRRARGLQYRAL